MAERNTYKYELKQGNKVVYVGISDDPARREIEHRRDKDFGKMVIVGNKSTRESAKDWEDRRIETYMNNHGGETPKYNKTEAG